MQHVLAMTRCVTPLAQTPVPTVRESSVQRVTQSNIMTMLHHTSQAVSPILTVLGMMLSVIFLNMTIASSVVATTAQQVR